MAGAGVAWAEAGYEAWHCILRHIQDHRDVYRHRALRRLSMGIPDYGLLRSNAKNTTTDQERREVVWAQSGTQGSGSGSARAGSESAASSAEGVEMVASASEWLRDHTRYMALEMEYRTEHRW